MIPVNEQLLVRALQVQRMHADGGRCGECRDDMRCPLLALWLPVIVQIRAGVGPNG